MSYFVLLEKQFIEIMWFDNQQCPIFIVSFLHISKFLEQCSNIFYSPLNSDKVTLDVNSSRSREVCIQPHKWVAFLPVVLMAQSGGLLTWTLSSKHRYQVSNIVCYYLIVHLPMHAIQRIILKFSLDLHASFIKRFINHEFSYQYCIQSM